MNQQEVFKIIADEREYQDLKWGSFARHGHEVGAWITLMRKHLNDAEVAWSSSAGDYDALDHIRKVAAIAVACGEQHGMVARPAIVMQMARSRKAAKDMLEAGNGTV